jgi:iron complex outermembrane receptor protein
MKFLVGCLLSALLINVFCYSYAQPASSIVKGTVLTESHTPADGATVTLLKYSDSSIVKSAICSKTGLFQFYDINPGGYIVLVHKIDYADFYSKKFDLTEATNGIDIGEITLQPLSTALKEVAITDKRDYIEVKLDKTVLNIDKSILAAGNSVFDILNTAPGVRIINNQVLFKGGQKALITINGKATSALSDEQMADLLKSYQSSMISQVELIESPSAKYDAQGGGGVINIILKKSMDIGFKANITESAAVGQDYKANTAINLNYRTQKLNLFGAFNYADNKIDRFLNLDRNVYDDGQVTNFDVDYTSATTTKNVGFNGGADYDISPTQTVGVLVHGYHNAIGIDKHNITDIRNSGVLDSDITTQSHIDRHITNLNYNFNYKGSFDKAAKSNLSADLDYSTYTRASSELLQNDFFDTTTGMPYRDPLFYTDNSPSQINIRSEKIDFLQILSKTGTLALGIKNSQVNSNNTIDFEQKADSGIYLPVPSLTDHFVYNERINAAYVSYDDQFNKTTLSLGLRGEQTNAGGESLNPNKTFNRSYFDLFPNAQITQPLGKDNQLTVGYNRRITRPNYQDLNPFVAYIDQYAYNVGNPFLNPEYINTYQATDLYLNKYKASLSMVVTNNLIAPIFLQNDSTKVYTTTNSNIGTRYQYIAEFWIPVNVTKWWNADVYLEGGYDRYVYGADSARKSTYDVTVDLTQTFNITSKLKAEVAGEYNSATYYGITQLWAQAFVRAGISQSILDNNGTIKLAVSDIFNSDRYRYSSHYLNLDLTGNEKPGTRFITATFTYRFGKQSVKSARSRVGGSFDEQKRLGGSTNDN